MTTNCKNGDIAFVTTRRGKYYGRLLKILGPAPIGSFTLPNGVHHAAPAKQPSWIVDILGDPINGVIQGVADDESLHPIPAHLLPSIKLI